MLSTFQRCSLLITLFKNLNPLCTNIIVHRGLYSIALFIQFFLCLEPELFCGFIACSHVDFQSKNGLQSYCTSFINDQFLMDRLTSGQGPIWRKDLLAGYIVQQCLWWWWWWCLLSALLRLVLKIKEHFCSFVLWLMMYVCGNQSRFFDRKYIYLLHIIVLTYLKYLEMRSMDFKTDTYYTSRALIICSLFNQYCQFTYNQCYTVPQIPKQTRTRQKYSCLVSTSKKKV